MDEKKIKYSIILPCFNVEKYIKTCLDSIFRNDIKNSEIILINDGSDDNFTDVCQSYFSVVLGNSITEFYYKNLWIKIISQENGGVSKARNIGIKNAKGQYILFVDPDDVVLPQWISYIDDCLNDKELDVLILGYKKIYESKSGEVSKEETKFPKQQYNISSNKDAVSILLPMYLGYSVDNILRWTDIGEFLPHQLEFGPVWRNVYRREFLKQHEILFNEKIRLNEDSMFNANCMLYLCNAKAEMKAGYCYISRETGALVSQIKGTNKVKPLIENKLALLEERTKITVVAKTLGYEFGIKDFAGSNVMSAIEITSKSSIANWIDVKRYLYHPIVKESVKMMSYTKMFKFNMALFCLKCKLGFVLLAVFNLMRKMGISLSL